MQTFLPYREFEASARCLDRQRLGKQRVEAKQILNVLVNLRTPGASHGPVGWYNHPAVTQWARNPKLLCVYGQVMCDEWKRRGYRDTCRGWFDEMLQSLCTSTPGLEQPPWWLGVEAFHKSHQARLFVKAPEAYPEFATVESESCCLGCNYWWPSHVEREINRKMASKDNDSGGYRQ